MWKTDISTRLAPPETPPASTPNAHATALAERTTTVETSSRGARREPAVRGWPVVVRTRHNEGDEAHATPQPAGRRLYDANGVFVPSQPGEPLDLWWDDDLHASKYGSYLDALVQFGPITGLDPVSLGAGETAALSLGISATDAVFLEKLAAQDQGMPLSVPEPDGLAMVAGGLALLAWTARRRRIAKD
jgi:hypothetical protein